MTKKSSEQKTEERTIQLGNETYSLTNHGLEVTRIVFSTEDNPVGLETVLHLSFVDLRRLYSLIYQNKDFCNKGLELERAEIRALGRY